MNSTCYTEPPPPAYSQHHSQPSSSIYPNNNHQTNEPPPPAYGSHNLPPPPPPPPIHHSIIYIPTPLPPPNPTQTRILLQQQQRAYIAARLAGNNFPNIYVQINSLVLLILGVAQIWLQIYIILNPTYQYYTRLSWHGFWTGTNSIVSAILGLVLSNF